MVCKLGTYCTNTMSNLLCWDHGVSHWYFLFCWRGQLHCYMNDYMKTWWSNVLTNLQMLNWGCSLCPFQLYLRQEIPQKIFCSQKRCNHYGNLLHLMDLFMSPTSWMLPTLFKRHFFSITRSALQVPVCLISIYLSVALLLCFPLESKSQVLPLFPHFMIKDSSYKVNRFSRDVNRLSPQRDW